MEPSFSLCIPTYKRAEPLGELLGCLIRQLPVDDAARFELIVADNDAGQSAKAVFESFSGQWPFECRYVVVPEKGLAAVRNRLIESAKCANIVFLDDDQLVGDDFLRQVSHECSLLPNDVVAAQFQLRCMFDVAIRSAVRDVARMMLEPNFPLRVTPVTTVATGGCVIRRDVLIDRGIQFDAAFSQTGGEDIRLSDTLRDYGRQVGLANIVVYEKISDSRSRMRWWLASSFHKGSVFVRAHFGGRKFLKGAHHLILALPLGIARVAAGLVLLPVSDARACKLIAKGLRQFGKFAGFCGLIPKSYARHRAEKALFR